MSKINKAWHEQHPMPKNPSLQQRIGWHLAHTQACQCRPIPAGILKAMQDQTPKPGA